MKTFERHRSAKELKAACKLQGWKFHDEKYCEGSDYISFEFIHGTVRAWVVFSTFNGTAMGDYTVGKSTVPNWFSTSEDALEHEPWFKALLSFLYVEKPAAPVFYNPRAEDLLKCRIKDLRGEIKHSTIAEIIEAKKHLDVDPAKNKSRIAIFTRCIARHAFMH